MRQNSALTGIPVEIRKARALAAHWKAGGVERALDRGWTVRPEVNRTACHWAVGRIRDGHGKVVSVHERHCRQSDSATPRHHRAADALTIVEIPVSVTLEGPFCYGGRRNALWDKSGCEYWLDVQ